MEKVRGSEPWCAYCATATDDERRSCWIIVGLVFAAAARSSAPAIPIILLIFLRGESRHLAATSRASTSFRLGFCVFATILFILLRRCARTLSPTRCCIRRPTLLAFSSPPAAASSSCAAALGHANRGGRDGSDQILSADGQQTTTVSPWGGDAASALALGSCRCEFISVSVLTCLLPRYCAALCWVPHAACWC